jgi:hypothetical protein
MRALRGSRLPFCGIETRREIRQLVNHDPRRAAETARDRAEASKTSMPTGWTQRPIGRPWIKVKTEEWKAEYEYRKKVFNAK